MPAERTCPERVAGTQKISAAPNTRRRVILRYLQASRSRRIRSSLPRMANCGFGTLARSSRQPGDLAKMIDMRLGPGGLVEDIECSLDFLGHAAESLIGVCKAIGVALDAA